MVFHQVAKQPHRRVLLTESHSKSTGIPFLEGVTVKARRKGTCHPARETKTLGISLFQQEFQAQSIEHSSLYISQQTQVAFASYAAEKTRQHGENQKYPGRTQNLSVFFFQVGFVVNNGEKGV